MAEEPQFPTQIDLVPRQRDDRGLTVWVHRHELPAATPVPCWTYVSQGFADLGGAELSMTLARQPEDDPTGQVRDPLEIMKVMYELAKGEGSGQATITAGQLTQLGGGGLFGRSDLTSLTYLPALPVVPGTEEALAVLVLTEDETAVVQRCGPMRVVARLGASNRHYPYPPWLDRTRVSVAESGEKSILDQTARLLLPGLHAHKEDETVVLSVPRGQRRPLAEQLGPLPLEAAFTLFTLPAPDATATLVWRPGQATPQAYGGPNATNDRVAGNFCLLVPQQDTNGGQLIEDGFAMMLTDTTWADLRGALAEGRQASIPADDDRLALALRWR